jgi:hypothetical protein
MIEAKGRNPPGESLYDLDSRQMCQMFIIYMFVPSQGPLSKPESVPVLYRLND